MKIENSAFLYITYLHTKFEAVLKSRKNVGDLIWND